MQTNIPPREDSLHNGLKNITEKQTAGALFAMQLLALIVAALSMVFDAGGEEVHLFLWPIIGTASLLAVSFILLRIGLAQGTKAYSLYSAGQQAGKTAFGSYDVSRVIRGCRAYVIIGYALSALYIAGWLISAGSAGAAEAGLTTLTQITRLLCWLFALPFLPPAMFFTESLSSLSFAVIFVLALYPLWFPCMYLIGYTGGKKQYASMEKAMIKGRRRARARSRVMKNNKPVI